MKTPKVKTSVPKKDLKKAVKKVVQDKKETMGAPKVTEAPKKETKKATATKTEGAKNDKNDNGSVKKSGKKV